jgi:hypothetical protein
MHLDRVVDETIVEWDGGQRYRIETRGIRSLAILQSDWSVTPLGNQTLVRVTWDYRVKPGLLGVVLDRLILRRSLSAATTQMLAGLKHYVETGQGASTEESQ